MTETHDIESVNNNIDRRESLEALERILRSSEFVASPHLAAFITYSVNETLAGRASSIKAYSVATAVLGRPPSFDPQADPIVRVEATRLRRALERYYAGIGSRDPVRISMPRGGYQVAFIRKNGAEEPVQQIVNPAPVTIRPKAAAFGTPLFRQQTYWAALFVLSILTAGWTWGYIPVLWSSIISPAADTESLLSLQTDAKISTSSITEQSPKFARIARNFRLGGIKVGTFSVEGDASMPWHVGAKLSEEFTEALSRFDAISVYDWRSATTPNDHDIYELSGRAVVEGSQTNTISVRIVHVESQRMVWSRDYVRTSTSRPGTFWRTDIIRAVASTIASADGVILRDSAAVSKSDDPARFTKYCIIRAVEAFRLPDSERRMIARQCLDESLKTFPNSPLLLGISARLRFEELEATPDELTRALEEAQCANVAAPQSALVTNILADINSRLGLGERATQFGKLAVELNPYDVTILASQATRLASLGDEAGANDLRNQIGPEFKIP